MGDPDDPLVGLKTASNPNEESSIGVSNIGGKRDDDDGDDDDNKLPADPDLDAETLCIPDCDCGAVTAESGVEIDDEFESLALADRGFGDPGN